MQRQPRRLVCRCRSGYAPDAAVGAVVRLVAWTAQIRWESADRESRDSPDGNRDNGLWCCCWSASSAACRCTRPTGCPLTCSRPPMLEGLIALFQTLDRGELGPFFDRFNRPGEIATHQFGGSPLLRARRFGTDAHSCAVSRTRTCRSVASGGVVSTIRVGAFCVEVERTRVLGVLDRGQVAISDATSGFDPPRLPSRRVGANRMKADCRWKSLRCCSLMASLWAGCWRP